MNNSGDKDILNAHPLALIQVIEQGDAAQAQAGTFYQNQSHFQAELNEGVLTHGRCRLVGLYKIVTKLNAFFDGSCCLKNLSLTFRGKLLNPKPSDKHETS